MGETKDRERRELNCVSTAGRFFRERAIAFAANEQNSVLGKIDLERTRGTPIMRLPGSADLFPFTPTSRRQFD